MTTTKGEVCGYCSAPLRESARFCRRCGFAVVDTLPPLAPDKASAGERVTVPRATSRPAPALPITIGPAAAKLRWLALGSGLFVLLGIGMVADGSLRNVLAGAAGVAFFSVCLVACVYMLRSGRPNLVIDAKGFNHTGLGHPSRVEWRSVESVKLVTKKEQPEIQWVARGTPGSVGALPGGSFSARLLAERPERILELLRQAMAAS